MRVALVLFLLSSVLIAAGLAGTSDGKIGLDRIDAAVSSSVDDEQFRVLMEKTAATGVRHIKIWVPWQVMDGEFPFSEIPIGGANYLVAPCLRTSLSDSNCWHRYYVGPLDRAVTEAERAGLAIDLGIHGPPLWSRGYEDVCEYDWGTVRACGGLIKQTHFQIFSDALYDFTYYISRRYPQVEYWIVGNEPNLDYAFNPEQSYNSRLDMYMSLIYEPMREALWHSGGNFPKLVGPEISLIKIDREIEEWIQPLLERYPNAFDVIGVHNYSIDAHKALEKMDQLRKVLAQYPSATQRVWVTEFAFGTDKEPLTRSDVFVFRNLLEFCSNQWWERSYFFSVMGPLLYDYHEPEKFGQEKPLYWLFKVMVQYLD